MHRALFRSVLLTAAFSVPVSLGAAASDPPALTAGRLAAESMPPVIDGVIDDVVWQSVAPFDTFTQQEPVEGAPASERTEVRALLAKDMLYLGIICFDSAPDQIVLTTSRRDADMNSSDSVQVVLDTFNDHQNGFVFGTNPMGIEYDGQLAGEGRRCSLPCAWPGPSRRSPRSALVQYNSQASQLSSNIRFAVLTRSGTGLFLVYNDRRDTLDATPETMLGRSFVVKYTRLFGF